ncbi:pentatricopeptide repeat-containing protein At3g12770-like [Cornus florida]|uniref:pentatricopeptide repeat-containing protein At3g12770-like n=1 Tax=Cornus florida TaxID=4283 RepID=UPI00289B4078|nr:pentatricopeptide repeat-containing protein At3g12770-like [Cornus florida]
MILSKRLITITTVKHFGAGLYKELSDSCSVRKCFSCVANQLFDEIPEYRYATELAKHSNASEALESLGQMDGFGKKPTKFILCSTLNSCAKTLNLHLGLQIHARLVQTGYEENLFISSALVDVYAKCGALADARSLFDSMKIHDQVSWTSIISGFSQNGQGREAILLFKRMLDTEIKPNFFTYVSVISVCTQLEGAFVFGALFHAHVIKLGCETNSFVVSSLIDCYSKCGRINQAMLLFDATTTRDNILLNSMISGYSQNLCGQEALTLFMEMRNDNLSPTDHTLTSILNACGSLTVLQQGRQVHALVVKMGSITNVFVVSALIDMYSKCGSIVDARRVFDETINKNSVLWTSMITGYAQSGKGLDGLELFDYLVNEEGVAPDHICFMAVLTACNHAGFLDRGIEYFNKMRDYGLVPELDHYACLVDLYARNGHLRRAKELMEEMPFDPNTVMWSSFLSSCKVYSEVELGREAAYKLFKMEPGSAVPYIMLANIYAGAGLWSEVAEIRNLMKQKGIRKNVGWSWIEVDKKVHVFSVGDFSHPQSQYINAELDKLNLEMKEAGCMPKLIRDLEDFDDEQL